MGEARTLWQSSQPDALLLHRLPSINKECRLQVAPTSQQGRANGVCVSVCVCACGHRRGVSPHFLGCIRVQLACVALHVYVHCVGGCNVHEACEGGKEPESTGSKDPSGMHGVPGYLCSFLNDSCRYLAIYQLKGCVCAARAWRLGRIWAPASAQQVCWLQQKPWRSPAAGRGPGAWVFPLHGTGWVQERVLCLPVPLADMCLDGAGPVTVNTCARLHASYPVGAVLRGCTLVCCAVSVSGRMLLGAFQQESVWVVAGRDCI